MSISHVLHTPNRPPLAPSTVQEADFQLHEHEPTGAATSAPMPASASTNHTAGSSPETSMSPQTLYQQVEQLGFSPTQMKRAVKNYNAKGIYHALLKHTDLFKGWGLSLDDIVKVAGNDGGAQALDAFGRHGFGLLQAGYTQADLVKVAANYGGAQALDALGRHGPGLLLAGYTQTDVVKVAANNGGAQALDALGRHGPGLLLAGYTQADIVKVAGNGGGAKALAILEMSTPTLLAYGYSLSDLASVGAVTGSAQRLSLISEHAAAIDARKLLPASVVQHAKSLSSVQKFKDWLLQQLA